MKQPISINLRPDVQAALREWNIRTVGRGMQATGRITDHEVIAELMRLALPNEDLNDTILRMLQGRSSQAIN